MAIKLENKPDVIAPNILQEFGQIEDFDSGVVPGTPVNQEVYGDFHQFFAKLMDFVGKGHNGQPDDSGNGYQLFDALLDIIQKQLAPSFWTLRTNPQDNQFWDITYGLGKFYAISDGVDQLTESLDGINWTLGSIPTTGVNSSIEYGNGVLMVPDGLLSSKISTDGSSWIAGGNVPFVDGGGGAQSRSVRFLNGKFYAINASPSLNHLATSVDGVAWNLLSTPNTVTLFDISFGNGIYVGVGSGGDILRSIDGVTWTVETPPVAHSFVNISYGNGIFVAVSQLSGFFTYSYDGITWIDVASPVPLNNWKSITFGRGRFIAISSSGTNDRSAVSNDGINWTVLVTNNNNWENITYNDGLFVAVSITGTGDRIMTTN